MNRRDAILAGISSIAAAIVVAPAAALAAEDESEKQFAMLVPMLKAHDNAFTNHDLAGVLATFATKSVLVGTGPGEMWSGKEELTVAYENFFKGFDKGAHDYEYRHRMGSVAADSAWLVSSGDAKTKKDGKEVNFPLNISFAFVKEAGAWKIALMHFSTLTPDKA